MNRLVIILILLALLQCACAPTRFVKPLESKQKAVGANIGGPLIGFAGTIIPIPFTSVYGGYGVNEKLTITGSVHLTAALYGVVQTDITALTYLWRNDSSDAGITCAPGVNVAWDKWEGNFKLWPLADVNYYKELAGKKRIFIGLNTWYEPAAKKLHGEVNQNHFLFNPHLGIQTGLKRKLQSQFEIKYAGAGRDNRNIVVDYKTPFNSGAIGIYYSLIKKF
jgi:hypothetical protein